MGSVDWNALADKASDGGFEALPPGDYDLKVIEASHTTTASTSKLMFKAKFQVTTGTYKGRLVWSQFVVSPESEAALGIFFRQMAAFGMTREWFKTLPSEDTIVNTMLHREIRAKLVIKKYNGEDRNEISAFMPMPVGGGTSAPPPPAATTASAPPPPPPAPPAPSAAPPAPAPAPAPVAEVPAPAPAPAPVAAAVAAPEPVDTDTVVDIPIPPPPAF